MTERESCDSELWLKKKSIHGENRSGIKRELCIMVRTRSVSNVLFCNLFRNLISDSLRTCLTRSQFYNYKGKSELFIL